MQPMAHRFTMELRRLQSDCLDLCRSCARFTTSSGNSTLCLLSLGGFICDAPAVGGIDRRRISVADHDGRTWRALVRQAMMGRSDLIDIFAVHSLVDDAVAQDGTMEVVPIHPARRFEFL